MSAGLGTCRFGDFNCLQHMSNILSQRCKWCERLLVLNLLTQIRQTWLHNFFGCLLFSTYPAGCKPAGRSCVEEWHDDTCVHVRWLGNLPTCLFAWMRLTSNIFDAQCNCWQCLLVLNLLTQCRLVWSRACTNENGCGRTWHEQQTIIRKSIVAHFACWFITCWQDTFSMHALWPDGDCLLVCDLLIGN